MRCCAIDPGNKYSACYVSENEAPPALTLGKVPNEMVRGFIMGCDVVVLEQVACMGMPVGEDVLETVFWSGRFAEVALQEDVCVDRIKRHEIKMHLCGNPRAKDSNLITSIVDRFDPGREYGKYGKGVKKNPGPFFSFSADLWQAYALYLTWWDRHNGTKA